MPGGGETYSYDVEGTTAQFIVPPESFSPLTATDAQLKEYGYAARPTTSAALAAWTQEMSYYKSTVVPDIAIPCQTNGDFYQGAPGSAAPTSGTQASEYETGNWAGFDAGFPSNSNALVGVEGNYYQPSDGSCSCTDPGEATWVGLGDGPGGDGNERLIQAGTGINQTYTNGNNPTYAGFYEWLDGAGGGSHGEIEIGNLGLSAGDAIFVSVEYDKSASQADFYVADNTTGKFGPPGVVDVNNAYYDGSTAEWIFERPTCSGCGNYSNGNSGLNLQNLANIGTGEFYTDGGPGAEAELSGGTWETLGYLNSQGDVNKTYVAEINTDLTFGSTMLSTSAIHSDGESFAVTWLLCE